MFREGDENLKIISQGRARKNEPNSHENSQDREFSLCSGVPPKSVTIFLAKILFVKGGVTTHTEKIRKEVFDLAPYGAVHCDRE